MFCEGQCQGWIHRKCVGVPALYLIILVSLMLYFCAHIVCKLAKAMKYQGRLSNILNELNFSITCLTETMKSLQTSVTNQTLENTATNSLSQSESAINKVGKMNDHGQGDRKFNVIIYETKECDKGTPRHERLKHDVDYQPILSDHFVVSFSINSYSDHMPSNTSLVVFDYFKADYPGLISYH